MRRFADQRQLRTMEGFGDLRSDFEPTPRTHASDLAILEAAAVRLAKPLDLGGRAMQTDEDSGNKVWDTHHGELRAQLAPCR